MPDFNEAECVHCEHALRGPGSTRTRSGGCEWHLIRRRDGRFGWHLVGDNGRDIIATDGSQGYERAEDAAAMMKKIRSGHYAACPMEPR